MTWFLVIVAATVIIVVLAGVLAKSNKPTKPGRRI